MVSLIDGTKYVCDRDIHSIEAANAFVDQLKRIEQKATYTFWSQEKRDAYRWVHNYLRDQQEALETLVCQSTDLLKELDRELSFIARNEDRIDGMLHPEALQRLFQMSGSLKPEGQPTLSEGLEEWKGALAALALQEELVMKSPEELQAWILKRVRKQASSLPSPMAAVMEPLEELDRTIRVIKRDFDLHQRWLSRGETEGIVQALNWAAIPFLETWGRMACDAFDTNGVSGIAPYLKELQKWRFTQKTEVFLEIIQKLDLGLLDSKDGADLKSAVIHSFLHGLPDSLRGLLSGELLRESKLDLQRCEDKRTPFPEREVWQTCAEELGLQIEVISPWDQGLELSAEGSLVPSARYRAGTADGAGVRLLWNGSGFQVLVPLIGKLSLQQCLKLLGQEPVEGSCWMALFALTLNSLIEERMAILGGCEKEKDIYLIGLRRFTEIVRRSKGSINGLRSVERMDFFRLILDPILGDSTGLGSKRTGMGPLARLANLELGQEGLLSEIFPDLS